MTHPNRQLHFLCVECFTRGVNNCASKESFRTGTESYLAIGWRHSVIQLTFTFLNGPENMFRCCVVKADPAIQTAIQTCQHHRHHDGRTRSNNSSASLHLPRESFRPRLFSRALCSLPHRVCWHACLSRLARACLLLACRRAASILPACRCKGLRR
jgi:hypothetical protein